MAQVRRGISTLEVLVTLAIILLLMSLAFPTYIKAIFKATATKTHLEHRDYGLHDD